MSESQIEFHDAPGVELLLNPGRWNHTIGDGDHQPWSAPYICGRATKFAARTVLNHITQGGSRLALHKFKEGEAFSSDEHDPGTVVLLATEMLHTTDEKRLPMETFATPSLVVGRPSIHGDRTIARRGYGYHFTGGVLWGVVTKATNRHTLYMFPTQLGPDAVKHDIMLPHSPSFTIGETVHSRSLDGVEILERVGALHICANGVANRRHFWDFKGLPNLGAQNA